MPRLRAIQWMMPARRRAGRARALGHGWRTPISAGSREILRTRPPHVGARPRRAAPHRGEARTARRRAASWCRSSAAAARSAVPEPHAPPPASPASCVALRLRRSGRRGDSSRRARYRHDRRAPLAPHVQAARRRGRSTRRPPRRSRSTRPPAGCTRPRSSRRGAPASGLVSQVATSDPAGRRLEVRLEAGRRRRALPARQDRRRRRSDRRRRDADRVRVARRRSASSASASARTRSTSAAATSRTTSPTGRSPASDSAIVRRRRSRPRASAPRDDATYYPVPWLLSSRGYGVLIDRDETRTFHLATDPKNAWSAEVAVARDRAARLRRPDAGRRRCAASPPRPAASRRPSQPWQFGPWFQTGQPNTVPLADEAAYLAQAAQGRRARCRPPRRSCTTCRAARTAATRTTRPRG